MADQRCKRCGFTESDHITNKWWANHPFEPEDAAPALKVEACGYCYQVGCQGQCVIGGSVTKLIDRTDDWEARQDEKRQAEEGGDALAPKTTTGDSVTPATHDEAGARVAGAFTNRHGERCSEACGQGRHSECTETLATCNCTYRGLHKTLHRYASIGEPVAQPGAGGERKADFECAARKAGTPGGMDPQDCGWPFCGCDPRADKVITSLLECGWNPPQHPLVAEPAAGQGAEQWPEPRTVVPNAMNPTLKKLDESYCLGFNDALEACKKAAAHVTKGLEAREQDGNWVGFVTTPKEHDAVLSLMKLQDLSKTAVLRQALRVYQAVATGHAKLVFPMEKKNDMPT